MFTDHWEAGIERGKKIGKGRETTALKYEIEVLLGVACDRSVAMAKAKTLTGSSRSDVCPVSLATTIQERPAVMVIQVLSSA